MFQAMLLHTLCGREGGEERKGGREEGGRKGGRESERRREVGGRGKDREKVRG